MLAKDTASLRRFWDANLIVNSPDNIVVVAKENSVDRSVMKKLRGAFTQEVEQILVQGDLVFSMGSETLVPLGDLPNADEVAKCRYTSILMKKGGEWTLVARHANVICQ